MENSFTFQQPRSQKRVLLIIFGASFFMVGGTFGIFALLGTESAASFVAFMVMVAAVMIGIVRMAKSGMRHLVITVGGDGFTVEDLANGEKRNYGWKEVKKHKQGVYSYHSMEKSYLWIWVKDGSSYFIEDNGADAERKERYREFRELAAHYLALGDETKEYG